MRRLILDMVLSKTIVDFVPQGVVNRSKRKRQLTTLALYKCQKIRGAVSFPATHALPFVPWLFSKKGIGLGANASIC